MIHFGLTSDGGCVFEIRQTDARLRTNPRVVAACCVRPTGASSEKCVKITTRRYARFGSEGAVSYAGDICTSTAFAEKGVAFSGSVAAARLKSYQGDAVA